MPRHSLLLPDLGLGDQSIMAGLWLAQRGAQVREGESVLEVVAGAAVVDLPSPADGILVKKLVSEGDRLKVGQCLAIVESDEAVD